MKRIGIITIHRIYNYGSVLQAYALQCVCKRLGYDTNIIDYIFPNDFQIAKSRKYVSGHKASVKALIIKGLCLVQLIKQHKRIRAFICDYLNLSKQKYTSPEELKKSDNIYDIYITGSDQLWNTRYTYGDTSFFLDFVPDRCLKISYAASFGSSKIDSKYAEEIGKYLKRYKYLSVREESGKEIIKSLIHRDAEVVVDPTLLLDATEWSKLAVEPRIKRKYILCYFLNYTYNAFPYVDDLADYISRMTGYMLVRVARPPMRLINKRTHFEISASPEEFIGLIKNAEIVLTTSFHGTAFAVNFSVPLFSVIENRKYIDTRQYDFLRSVGMEDRILSMGDEFPSKDRIYCDYTRAQAKLNELRARSLDYLRNSLKDEQN